MKKIEIFVGSDSAFEKIVPKVQEILVKWQRNLMMVIKKWMCLLTFQGSQNQSLRKRRTQEFKILLFMQTSIVMFKNMLL